MKEDHIHLVTRLAHVADRAKLAEAVSLLANRTVVNLPEDPLEICDLIAHQFLSGMFSGVDMRAALELVEAK